MNKNKIKNKFKILSHPWVNGRVSTTSLNKVDSMSYPFYIITDWTLSHFFPNVNRNEAKRVLNIWTKWWKTRGPKWTITRIKFMRLTLIRYLSGCSLERIKYVKYSGKSPLPNGLPFVREILSGDIESIRASFSVLEYGKIINYWDPPSFESITNPGISEDISADIIELIKDFKLSGELSDVNWEKYHYSAKAGPNGPALASALIDLKKLDIGLINNIKTLGGPLIQDYIDKLQNLLDNVSLDQLSNSKKKYSNRRISIVRDPEGKNRPIAIFDYWSQTVLKPIHDKMFHILNKFSPDKTFSQRRVNPGEHNYCFDLSKFTDRFPVTLQRRVMEELFMDYDKAKAWEYILVHNGFAYKELTDIKYSVGQPMGAYSSWAVCTFTHHLVVQLAIKRAGLKPSLNSKLYALLGDDIVIYQKDVALHYEDIINSLGVEISPEKTTKSKDFMEFAKCYFYKGINVTPFHLNALYRSYKSFDMFCSFINNLHIDGYDVNILSDKDIKALLVSLGLSRRWSSRQAKLLKVYSDLNNYVKDPDNNKRNPFKIIRSCNMYWSCNSIENHAPEFLMEVCASLKLQSLQDAFISGVKRINMSVKAHISDLNQLGVSISQEDLSYLPIVCCLIEQHRSVAEETQTFEGAATQMNWLELFRNKYAFLPDASTAISLKPRKHHKDQSIKPLVQKLCNFLIQENLEIENNLRD